MTNGSFDLRVKKIQPTESKNIETKHGEKPLPFNLPISYVVFGAKEYYAEAKTNKKIERRQGGNWIDESYKPEQNTTRKTQMHMTSKSVKNAHKIRKSNPENPDSYRTPWFQEKCVKRPRKQGTQPVNRRKTSAVKRRPLSVPSQKVELGNDYVSSAILSSEIISKEVYKEANGSKANIGVKKKTRLKNHVHGVPTFSSIPNEFLELCKNKSVDKILSNRKITGKESGELYKSFRQPKETCYKRKHSNSEDKQPDNGIQQTNGGNGRQDFSKSESSFYSNLVRKYGASDDLQVPKNIYIREESGGEMIEDLVEVRNQDDLDVLNTLTTLQLVKNKHSAKPAKLFENLQDYEIYYYPTYKTTSRYPKNTFM